MKAVKLKGDEMKMFLRLVLCACLSVRYKRFLFNKSLFFRPKLNEINEILTRYSQLQLVVSSPAPDAEPAQGDFNNFAYPDQIMAYPNQMQTQPQVNQQMQFGSPVPSGGFFNSLPFGPLITNILSPFLGMLGIGR